MSLFEKIVKTIITALCMLLGIATVGFAIAILKGILLVLPTFLVFISVIILVVCPVVYLAWQYVEDGGWDG